jgi:hypothetical protein
MIDGQRKVNYPGVVGCLQTNINILKGVEKRLNDEFLTR